MYAKFREITLVKDKSKRSASDIEVFTVERGGETIVLFAPNAQEIFDNPEIATRWGSTMPEKYGTAYIDARDEMCVVPYVWNEQHADRAKNVITAGGEAW